MFCNVAITLFFFKSDHKTSVSVVLDLLQDSGKDGVSVQSFL